MLDASSSTRMRTTTVHRLLLLLLLLLASSLPLAVLASAAAAADGSSQEQQPAVCSSNGNRPADDTCDGSSPSTTTTTTTTATSTRSSATSSSFSDNAECRVLLAPSSISATAGLGVFVAEGRSRGRAVLDGDLVLQVPDLVAQQPQQQPQQVVTTTMIDPGLQAAVHDYFWSADETLGFYEGPEHVVSAVPGVGALANGMPRDDDDDRGDGSNQQFNALPHSRTMRVDEGGLTRTGAPTAGAVTHYHNYTFVLQADVAAGQEILVHYGAGWFRRRHERGVPLATATLDANGTVQYRRPVDWLRQHGRCLDHLAPSSSRQEHAGRGAVARRDLRRGAIVAPVPLLALHRASLRRRRLERRDGTVVEPPPQLLLNYCLGHSESSLLLFPYGSFVNLVNHGAGQSANVRLQWSTSKILYGPSVEPDWFRNLTVEELLLSRNQQGRGLLLLELVALRDIRAGEEVLLDYGEDFARAYEHHVENWEPVPGAEAYAPSYVYDDVIKTLRTEKELKDHPYPDNIFTSCYYRYSDNKSEAEKQLQEQEQEQRQQKNREVTAFRWRRTRGLLEPRNLRPCSILQRNEEDGTFTVRIRNRYGLAAEERLAKGAMHIVTHVPRYAIRFSDKIYTTDQHLENAFRHEIGIPDDIFPEKWKDLKHNNSVDQ